MKQFAGQTPQGFLIVNRYGRRVNNDYANEFAALSKEVAW